jgi:ABC-type nitrate/sulfonate/bicarbonate transport system permease component
MVVAELIIVSTGIGALLKRYQATFDPVGVFALVIVFLAIGLILVHLVSLAERRFLIWR